MTKNLPFSNGAEYCLWTDRNCDRCSKAGDGSTPGSSSCEIFEAIHDAAIGIDIVDRVAARFGVVDNESFSIFQNCPERIEVAQKFDERQRNNAI